MGTLLLPSKLGVQVIRALLWAGLRHEEPTLTLAKSGELIDGWLTAGGKLEDLAKKLNEALREAGFKAEENGKPTKPATPAGTEAAPAGPSGSGPG